MRISISLVAVAGGGLLVSTSSASASCSPNAISPFASASASASACTTGRRRRVAGGPHLGLAFATVSSDVVDKAKNRVLSLASNIKEDSKTGVFIADAGVRSDLKRAVADLEAVCGNPTDRERQLMIGDWTLLCTTNSADGRGNDDSSKNKKGPKLPFKLPELPFQNKLTKSISVTQRIRCMDEGAVGDAKVIDRVDNVIEFTPFADTFGDLLGDSLPFAALKDLTVNPLEVKKSKISLIHKAEVQSVTPVLRTKINLQSYVLTVAGTSQYLEPEGADLLGLNVPLAEFQSGLFDTTYVDEELRISRGKVGVVDVLRVFVRKGIDAEVGALVDEDAIAGSTTTPDGDGAAPEEEGDKPNKLEEVRSAVEGVADAVRKVNEDVMETIKDDMDDVVEAVEGVADAVIGKENREMIENEIKGEIKNVEDLVEDVEESISELRDAAQNVTTVVQKVGDDVSDAIKDDVDDVVEAVEGVADAVIGKENREMIEKEIEGEIKNVQETAEDVQDAIKEVQSDIEEQLGINQEEEGEDEDESSD